MRILCGRTEDDFDRSGGWGCHGVGSVHEQLVSKVIGDVLFDKFEEVDGLHALALLFLYVRGYLRSQRGVNAFVHSCRVKSAR